MRDETCVLMVVSFVARPSCLKFLNDLEERYVPPSVPTPQGGNGVEHLIPTRHLLSLPRCRSRLASRRSYEANSRIGWQNLTVSEDHEVPDLTYEIEVGKHCLHRPGMVGCSSRRYERSHRPRHLGWDSHRAQERRARNVTARDAHS